MRKLNKFATPVAAALLAVIWKANYMPAAAYGSAEPEVPVHAAISSQLLEGHVQMQDDANGSLLSGLWKGHVIEYHRHPTVTIETQHGSELQGIYKGLIGKFPLTGVYDQNSGAIRLFVDISKSRLMKLLGVKDGIAILQGKVNGDTINGTGNIPDLGGRLVHFEATRSRTTQQPGQRQDATR